jgi:hypothetical protein
MWHAGMSTTADAPRQWCVWYDDGRIYRSDTGPVDAAPCDGVIVIAQADADVGRELLHLKDFYYWERSRWFGCDRYGMEDYLRRPGWKKVIAGRNTEPATYHALMDRARLDPWLPAKSALLTGEPRQRV